MTGTWLPEFTAVGAWLLNAPTLSGLGGDVPSQLPILNDIVSLLEGRDSLSFETPPMSTNETRVADLGRGRAGSSGLLVLSLLTMGLILGP